MAKGGKNLNPADAHRKALRKKELKKNKITREKTREVTNLKKDTGGLDAEIRRLEEAEHQGELDKNQKARLEELRVEVQRIKKTKAEYVAAHPEHRKLVFGEHSSANSSREKQNDNDNGPFGKNGLPKHPERSIYYHPTMNPYGMPPPGMPYVERPLLPHELPQVEGDAGSEEGEDLNSDFDIPLPSGPPPLPPGGPNEDDDDDIPMPSGPPPSRPSTSDAHQSHSTHLPLETPDTGIQPPLPFIGPGSMPLPNGLVPLPSPDIRPPLPPLGMVPPFGIPPPPPGFPPLPFNVPFAGNLAAGNPTVIASPQPHRNLGPRGPPSFIQDPLSSEPHRPYQSQNQGVRPPLQSSRPTIPHPSPSISQQVVLVPSATTIVAEPQLRDFKKESTAFVPNVIKRKKAQGPVATSSHDNKRPRVDAAPESGDPTEDNTTGAPVPDLLGTLRSQFPVKPDAGKTKSGSKTVDDYDNFMAEMGDILRGSGAAASP